MAEDARALAQQWLAADPDPDTRAELAALMAGDSAELAERFSGRLTFGTAGLRGRLGAGPLAMNRVLVRMAASALADVLIDRGEVTGGVAVGYDARRKSDVFAHDTARVLSGRGIDVHLLDRPLPTPLLAFTVLDRGCAAGVMVTASHNPPADNGYKVYWGDGAQIVPPIDRLIEERITATAPLADNDLDLLLEAAGSSAGRVDRLDVEATIEAYLDAIAGPARAPRTAPVVAYTALHGVGGDVVERAFRRAGFPPPLPVAAQQQPDGTFPTVSFPNPEEPGALDLVLELAGTAGAPLVLANDPDADRLAAAVADAAQPGGYRQLSGDELGVLLGEFRIRHTDGDDRLVANSLVSSGLLAEVAAAAGVDHRDTLTGFKWIMRAAADAPGRRLIFGYEEALGYAVSESVRDKDGISAALAAIELATELAAEGRTLLDKLDELAGRFGLHATAQVSPRFDTEPERVEYVMAALRARPPATLAGSAVVSSEDFLTQGEPADLLRWHTAEGDRVIVRPSGTEPKVKCYLEITVPVSANGLEQARESAAKRLDALSADVRALLRAD
jgi:phosphomannomutase